jgi:hypothetical protein
VYANADSVAINLVLFNFGHVVSDVVHLAQLKIFDLTRQYLLEAVPDHMCQQLPVGEGEVCGTCHGVEVFLPLLGIKWRAD